MQTETQETMRKDPIADLIGESNEDNTDRDAGGGAGRQVGRTRPSPEEINAQVEASEQVLCIRKDDGLAFEAYAISDGIASRPWNAEEDAPYDWSLTLDFLRDHQIFRLVDESATVRSLTSLVQECTVQRERAAAYRTMLWKTYASLGKNGRRKMEAQAEYGLAKALRASVS